MRCVADHCVRDVSRLINRLTFLLIYPYRRPLLEAFRQVGSWIFGGGLDRTSQMPRCLRMARFTDGSSMLLMTRMAPLHLGQTRGSTSFIF